MHLVKKEKTVIGMPQSFKYQNKANETNDAAEWMEAIAKFGTIQNRFNLETI